MRSENEHKFTGSLGRSEKMGKTPEVISDESTFEKSESPERNKQKVSLDEVYGGIAKEIIESLENPYMSKDEILGQYEVFQSHHMKMGQMGAALFDHLAQKGLAKPDKTYDHQLSPGAFLNKISRFNEKVAVLKEEMDLEEARLMVAEGLSEDYISREPIRSESFSEATGVKEQSFFQKIPIKNTSLLLQECVFNFPDQKIGNVSLSNLKVFDVDWGGVLELNQLLPNNYSFLPGQLRSIKVDYDSSTGKSYAVRENIDLNTYNGTQEAKGDYCELGSSKLVSYGDLTNKGDRLTLLHEIAHAWQSCYQSSQGRQNFEKFFNEVTTQLQFLGREKFVLTDISEEDKEFVWNFYKKELDKWGVEVEKEDFIFNKDRELKEGEYKISKLGLDVNSEEKKLAMNSFVIRSNKLKPLVEDYVREERDAWAHAIRVLRFFRRQGLDLEPELKTLDDIRDVVHYALGTYQKSIESKIEPTKDIKKFTIISRYHPEID
jgi:hypothetical protein